MMNRPEQNYFEQVLGLNTLLMPEVSAQTVGPAANSVASWRDLSWTEGAMDSAETAFVAIVSQSNARQAKSEMELLRKMAQATKADAQKVLLLLIPESEASSLLQDFDASKFINIIWLGEPLFGQCGMTLGELKATPTGHWLGTYGLEELHRQPELKKSAWTHMKKLIAKW